MRALVVVALVAAIGCTPRKRAFTCTLSDQCLDGNVQGACEPTGFCSFPDASCADTGRRYGAFADEARALTCVVAPCGAAGDPCCAAAPACSDPQLQCIAGRCTGCVTQLAAGAAHTCALRRDGSVLCWGANDHGQLGLGSTQDAPLPAPVVDDHGVPLANVVSVTAGDRHTCLLLGDATIRCFGDDSDGQLGTGTGASANPVPMPIGLQPIGTVAAGARHTCATTTNGNLAWCWGANEAGQLGSATASNMPKAVLTPATTQLGDVMRLAAGATHTCALLGDATLRCWGDDTDGELGDGTPAATRPPTAVTALGATVQAVATGTGYTCALGAGGVPSCFGANTRGQVGLAPSARVPAPTAVPGVDGVTAIASGAVMSCARRAGGEVVCWGADRAPAAIADLRGDAIAVGGAHACVVAADGVRCFGTNDRGQLGVGDENERDTPAVARVSCP